MSPPQSTKTPSLSLLRNGSSTQASDRRSRPSTPDSGNYAPACWPTSRRPSHPGATSSTSLQGTGSQFWWQDEPAQSGSAPAYHQPQHAGQHGYTRQQEFIEQQQYRESYQNRQQYQQRVEQSSQQHQQVDPRFEPQQRSSPTYAQHQRQLNPPAQQNSRERPSTNTTPPRHMSDLSDSGLELEYQGNCFRHRERDTRDGLELWSGDWEALDDRGGRSIDPRGGSGRSSGHRRSGRVGRGHEHGSGSGNGRRDRDRYRRAIP